MTGKPFDITSDALLSHMMAQVTGLGDFSLADVTTEGCGPQPAIKAPIAV